MAGSGCPLAIPDNAFLGELPPGFLRGLVRIVDLGFRLFGKQVDRLKEGSQPVEIMLRNRIDLVVMALRTPQVQPQHDLADIGCHRIQEDMPPLVL